MQTKTCMGLATAVATVFAGTATAQSVDFALELAAGGQMVETTFEHTGSIDTAHIALDFTNSGDYTWAGDVTLGLIAPDGSTVEFGGYDVFFGYPSAGDFPAEWDVSASGSFTHDIDFAGVALSGDGTWTLQVMNGYSGSGSADWVGNFGGEGCDDCPTNDCNDNGVEDVDDIANGTSQDCDNNLVPDECQSDCDGNGTPDACDDPCPGVSFDIDGPGGEIVEYTFSNTGVMDEIEIEFEFTNYGDLTWAGDLLFAVVAPDGSGVQFGGYDLVFNDYPHLGDFDASYDVADSGPYPPFTFYFPDPDALEGEGEWTLLVANGYSGSTGARWAGMASFEVCDDCIVDCNDNGVADSEDIANGTSEDCDSNGRPDECDIADGGDANGDGTLDACQEADCTFEATGIMVDGPGTTEASYTVDFSGAVEAFTCGGTFTNTSGDLTWAGDVLVGITDPNGNSVEFGGYDHTFGYVSIGDFPASWDVVDSGEYAPETMNAAGYGLMGDGTWTIQIANGYGASAGSSWDLTVAFCSLGDPGPTDCNDNGIDDAQDIADGTSEDCDGDGVPDECETDSDGDGTIDDCECEDSPDLNGDGCVNGADVGLILSVWGATDPAYGDLNCDGTVNGADFGIVLAGWTGC